MFIKSRVLKSVLLLSTVFLSFVSQAQTTIMSPSVDDGGFESSPTTWNFIQNTTSTTSANKWEIGSTSTGTNIPGVVGGSNAAYITTGASGAPWAYSTGTSRISHMYKDITFPAGETLVTLTFNWRGRGEGTAWDNLAIYLAPTTYTPTSTPPSANTNAMAGADLVWAETVPSSLGSYTSVTVTIPASFIGNGSASSDRRLIFTWKNDGSGGDNPPAAVDDITITSCAAGNPSGLTVLGSTSATLGWYPATGATGYEVRYKLTSDPTTVTTWATPTVISSGSTTTLAISGLTANSTYEYQVQAVGTACNSFSASSNFTTLCAAVSIPQTEGFNISSSTTNVPSCWSEITLTPSSNTTAANISQETSGSSPSTSPAEGTGMIRFNSASNNGGVMRLVSLPVSTTGVASVDVNFQWRFDGNTTYNSGTYLLEGMQLQYSVNGGLTWTDAGTFRPRSNTSTAWSLETVTLPAAAGNQSTLLVGFHFTSKYGNNCFLDAVSIVPTPSCIKPTSLTATLTSSTSASLVWVAPTSGATPLGYEWYVSTSSTTPPTAAGTGTFEATTSVAVPSLAPLTTYYAFVRTQCSSTTFSDWTLSATFTTPCAAVTLPQLEGFNTSGTTVLPSCWGQAIVASTSTAPALTFETSTVHPSGYSPYEGTRMVRFNSWSCQDGAKMRLISMALNTTANTSVDVDFKWFESTTYPSDPNSVQIQYSTDGTNWINAGSAINQYNAVQGWKSKTVTLPAGAAGQSLMFVGFLFQSDYGDDCYLDGVRIRETPTCYPPANISAALTSSTSATLNWSAPTLGNTPANYEYTLSTSSTAPTSAGTSIPGTSTSLPVTSTTSGSPLAANTTYYVYMRSKCSVTDSSDWSEVITFTTPCDPIAVPVVEPFGSSLASCWVPTEGVPGSSTQWATTTADASHGVSGPQAGTHFAFLDVYNAEEDYNPYYLTLPPVTIPNNNNTLYYYYFLGANGFTGSTQTTSPLIIQVSTDYGTNWTSVYTHSSSNSTTSSSSSTAGWYENNISLSSYAGQTIMLRFKSNSNYGVSRCNLGVDELHLTLSQPTATNGERCGPGAAVCSVSSNSGVVSPVFNWYTSQTGGSALTGQSGSTLSSYIITATTDFWVSETAAGVESRRTKVTATVNPLPVATLTPSHVTCYNGNDGAITSNVTSGTGTITYSWNTTPIETTSDISNLTAGTYELIVTDTKGCKDTTTATVNNASTTTQVAIGTQPVNATICYDGNTSFTVVATGNAPLSYLWEYRTSASGTFATVTNGGVYTNATAASLTLTSVPVTMNGYQYRVTVSGPCGSPKVSNTVTLTVNQTNVSVSISPSATTICAASSTMFTSTVTGGGFFPTYTWKNNGVTVANTEDYTAAGYTLNNGDEITLEVNSNAVCPNPLTAVSNTVTMTVNPMLIPSVSVAASPATSICPGNTVTFTATPTNGGTPTYVWKKNGVTIPGSGSANTYSTSTITTGDVFTAEMTSTETCRTANTATSAGVTITVVPASTPTISLAVSPSSTICAGSSITYTATVTNEGNGPTYVWRNNGSLIPGAPNSRFFTTTGASNGDVITCEVISNKPCVTVNSVTSNTITMTVNPVLTPSLYVSVTPDSVICSGSLVTFTANSTNAGPTPTYQWRVNGTDMAGATAATYSASTLSNGDVISCGLTTSVPCPSIPTISSINDISIDVLPTTAPQATLSALPNNERFIQGDTLLFVAVAANAGVNPSYVWYRNGARLAGVYGPTYRTYVLNEGDEINVVIHSSDICSDPDTAISNTITLKDVTGIPQMAKEDDVNLYPNPNSGVFVIETINNYNIKGQEAKYEVLSNVGQLVQRGNFQTQTGSFKQQISMESMASGTYFIRVSVGDYQIMKRFVKQ